MGINAMRASPQTDPRCAQLVTLRRFSFAAGYSPVDALPELPSGTAVLLGKTRETDIFVRNIVAKCLPMRVPACFPGKSEGQVPLIRAFFPGSGYK